MRQPPQVAADYNGIGRVIGGEAASIPGLATRHGRAGVVPVEGQPPQARGRAGSGCCA